MTPSLLVTTSYRFHPLRPVDVDRIRSKMVAFARDTGLLGLCLLGEEGYNLTVSGSQEVVEKFKGLLSEWVGLPNLGFKDARARKDPFHEFKVKVKKEIVTLGRPDLKPALPINSHLSPLEWHQALSEPDTVVIDTRNDYEVEIGKFKSAVDFGIKEFREFPEALRSSHIPRDKKVLIYCTGGIRCEKAILDMQEQGYKNVYQLEGGILNYLKEFPEKEFAGECFVFDYRVAVDQKLEPSQRFKLCPHCGGPAAQPVTCALCETPAVICHHCAEGGQDTCSKNCAHHRRIGSNSRRAQT